MGFHRSPKNIYNYEMRRMKKTVASVGSAGAPNSYLSAPTAWLVEPLVGKHLPEPFGDGVAFDV